MAGIVERSARLLRTTSILFFRLFAMSWACISALDLMSVAAIFLISPEVKAEYCYDAIERATAIAPIKTRSKMLLSLESL